ncbi:hypothetical protein [Sphingosinicella sp. BN140058]|uniref:hypothetical protein n=1 Tax=Sphingosinicella sp. BN140058 TaxID=1892855 RepID=UPI001012C9B3|nr:hypothetical protein [Sphingosinicella sp. BN140058]QAY80389.1 hypothetical protein ETR14_27500 [Sphingosinicella sp. BN140058]
MRKILLVGRILRVVHHATARDPGSMINFFVGAPYGHQVNIEVPWSESEHPNSPGEAFIDALAGAADLVINATVDDEGQLTADRRDIYVRASHRLG